MSAHPNCHGLEHVCQVPSGLVCIERGCGQPAGTLWGPLWCPAHDRWRLERIEAGLVAIARGRTGLSVGLSVREVEMVQFLSLGLTNKEIGERMGLSANTVKTMMARAMRRNNTPDRAALVARALRERWIE